MGSAGFAGFQPSISIRDRLGCRPVIVQFVAVHDAPGSSGGEIGNQRGDPAEAAEPSGQEDGHRRRFSDRRSKSGGTSRTHLAATQRPSPLIRIDRRNPAEPAEPTQTRRKTQHRESESAGEIPQNQQIPPWSSGPGGAYPVARLRRATSCAASRAESRETISPSSARRSVAPSSTGPIERIRSGRSWLPRWSR